MSVYRFFYFNVLFPRGETPRLLFAHAQQPYEDKRIASVDWMKGLKAELNPPFGQLPILEVDYPFFSIRRAGSKYDRTFALPRR